MGIQQGALGTYRLKIALHKHEISIHPHPGFVKKTNINFLQCYKHKGRLKNTGNVKGKIKKNVKGAPLLG